MKPVADALISGLIALQNVRTREYIRSENYTEGASKKVTWRMIPCDTFHNNCTWMSELPCLDVLTLGELTVPGTHNSAIYNFQEPLSPSPDAPAFLQGSVLKSTLSVY